MKQIDKNKVPMKYLIGYNLSGASIYDMLYELVMFLQNENKDYFTEVEAKAKTKSRCGSFDENFEALISNGFIEKDKYSKYKLISHLWE